MRLLIVTIGYTLSAIVTAAFGLFVLFSSAKKVIRVTFFAMAVCVFIFEISFLFSSNLKDPHLSYIFGFLNIIYIFIAIFNAHWILAVLDRLHEQKKVLYTLYGIALVLSAIYLIFPNTFLAPSVPKMYFNNYNNAGSLYFLSVLYFGGVFAYFYYFLIKDYFTKDFATRNRIKYFMASLAFGYGVGCTTLFLVYDIKVDPVLSMLTGFYTMPLAYGIVKRQIMDIRVVIKKALLYSIAIALLIGGLTAVAFLSDFFVRKIPGFRFWFVPAIAGVSAFIVGKLFWNKSKETEKLKYEFITVAAHKLRTPLTHIKWVADALLQRVQTEDEKRLLKEIYKADNRLVELADILLETSKEEVGEYIYYNNSFQCEEIVIAVCDELKFEMEKKRLQLKLSIPKGLPPIYGDVKRIRSAIRIFLENAVIYTPVEGSIEVSIMTQKNKFIFSVKDSGIGISIEDQKHIFERFFRSHKAALTDTEGSGLGLFIAKNIIERHGGAIGLQSEGEGKGTRFWFSLPI